jgi:RimJ/RimL family protein N-acetyltransferase
LRLSEVRAFARPDNIASRRVLEKSGFAEVRFVPEMGRLLYCRRRNGA